MSQNAMPETFRMCPKCSVHRVWERRSWGASGLVALWWCYHCSWEGPIEQTIFCRREDEPSQATRSDDVGR